MDSKPTVLIAGISGTLGSKKQLGSVEELKAWITKTQQYASSPFDYLMQQ